MTEVEEIALTGELQGTLLIPARRNDLGVVVLSGSSGRVDAARAKLFADLGAVAQDVPLPFIASDPYWKREYRDGLMCYRGLYEQSLRRFASEVDAATIPVEAARAKLLLVAGGDDALWPSEWCARSIVDRLGRSNTSATLLFHPDAGHRILLPGETTARSTLHAHGGNDQADRELGDSAWEVICRIFDSLI